MCNKAANVCLSALKFFPDWLVTSKILEIFDNVTFYNDDIDIDYINSDIATFFSDEIDINTIDLNNSVDDLESMIHAKLAPWCKQYKQRKAFKKN